MKTKNNEILILIGIPGSGKSTFAKDYVLNNPDWIRVSRDEFRYALKNQQMCDPKIEDLITKLVVDTTRSSLNKKLNVILDATHVRVKYIEAIIEEFKYEANINYRVFDISVKKAIERDSIRDKKVGPVVIEKMFEQYKILVDSFHFQPHNKINKRPTIDVKIDWTKDNNAFVFDIDGTAAYMGNRSPFDWSKVGLDKVCEPVKLINGLIADSGNFKIIFLSGRDGSCRKETEQWLKDNNFIYDVLFMRSENDYRKDNIIKKEIYENEIKDKYNVIAVYDDRPQVVRMWNQEGLYVFNCNQFGLEF